MTGEVDAFARGDRASIDESNDISSGDCAADEGQRWASAGAPFPYHSRCERAYGSSDERGSADEATHDAPDWLLRMLAVFSATTNPLKGIGSAVSDGISGSVAESLVNRADKSDKATDRATPTPAPAKQRRSGGRPVLSKEDWSRVVRYFQDKGRKFDILINDIASGKLKLSDKTVPGPELAKKIKKDTLVKQEERLVRKDSGLRLPTSAADKQDLPPSSLNMDWDKFLEAQQKYLKSGGRP